MWKSAYRFDDDEDDDVKNRDNDDDDDGDECEEDDDGENRDNDDDDDDDGDACEENDDDADDDDDDEREDNDDDDDDEGDRNNDAAAVGVKYSDKKSEYSSSPGAALTPAYIGELRLKYAQSNHSNRIFPSCFGIGIDFIKPRELTFSPKSGTMLYLFFP
jgi:hypothetical protein